MEFVVKATVHREVEMIVEAKDKTSVWSNNYDVLDEVELATLDIEIASVEVNE